MYGDLKILTGTANPQLAMDICDHLGCALTPALCETFSDGELRVEIGASVRGHDVFVIQPTCAPTNRNLMQLCLMLDALKRASAGRITAVIPYYGYARQDRKVSPRAPISAKMVADFLSMAGAQRIVTVDLHAGQIQGFFNCPVDNLFASPVLVDDMIDTAGTICAAAEVLLQNGASEVRACATHAVLSGPACQRLTDSPFTEIVVTDTIPLGEHEGLCDKLRVASVAGILAKSIRNIHDGSSVSALFG